jgi:hypothetical protein
VEGLGVSAVLFARLLVGLVLASVVIDIDLCLPRVA